MSKNEIYVFGSNLVGRHGRGSAKVAFEKYGAQYNVGFGPQGNSFAIPTKDESLSVLPLERIEYYVECFTLYACTHQELTFLVVEIGCGLAGYRPDQIAPMFAAARCLPNVKLPSTFIEVIDGLMSEKDMAELRKIAPLGRIDGEE